MNKFRTKRPITRGKLADDLANGTMRRVTNPKEVELLLTKEKKGIGYYTPTKKVAKVRRCGNNLRYSDGQYSGYRGI